ncbi:MAG: hypothetical protein SGI92_31460 [Bryobacteraceae bacterium]|nr:hypothetical protein [Bryobacteraceae bacterium]
MRQKISTNLNYFYVESTPLVRPLTTSIKFGRLAELTGRLVSITPEIQLGPPALDPRERAELRAEIDAIVTGLSSPPSRCSTATSRLSKETRT